MRGGCRAEKKIRYCKVTLLGTHLSENLRITTTSLVTTEKTKKEQGTPAKMPSATEEKVAPKIIDPASEHGDEIDASVDRDRIRVVSWDENACTSTATDVL